MDRETEMREAFAKAGKNAKRAGWQCLLIALAFLLLFLLAPKGTHPPIYR